MIGSIVASFPAVRLATICHARRVLILPYLLLVGLVAYMVVYMVAYMVAYIPVCVGTSNFEIIKTIPFNRGIGGGCGCGCGCAQNCETAWSF
jgi:hypothetical protein